MTHQSPEKFDKKLFGGLVYLTGKILPLFQYLGCVVFGVDLFDDFGEDTIFVKDECLAQGTHILTAIKSLLSPCSKNLNHFCRCVCEEGEGKFIFLRKLLMRVNAVLADADDIISFGNHRLIVITDIASLLRTSACIILRIEIDDGLLSQ